LNIFHNGENAADNKLKTTTQHCNASL